MGEKKQKEETVHFNSACFTETGGKKQGIMPDVGLFNSTKDQQNRWKQET